MEPASGEPERVHPASVPEGQPALSPARFFATVPTMLRIVAMLVLAASVLIAGPAGAHVGSVERSAFEAPDLPAPPAASPSQFLIAGEATGFPWPIVLIALLAASAVAHRRSRRVVAAALTVLLAIMAVEAAVHSVHHASTNPVACPTAAIAAHLDGTTVAALAVDEPIHRVGALTAPTQPLLASLRSLDASNPRAPPFPLV